MSDRSAAALMAALCLSMSACATAPAPYQGPSHESLALSVTNASDLVGLRDAKLPKGASAPSPGPTLPGAALSGGLNALSPPMGFSSLGGGLMGFASAFLSGPGPEAAASTSRLIAWMPLSEADTAETAAEKLDQLVQVKLAEALAQVDLGPGYAVQKAEMSVTGTRRTVFGINGGECDEPKVRCGYGVTSTPRPVQGFAPAFLGGYPAWSYTRTSGIPTLEPSFRDNRSWRASFRAAFPDLEVFRRFSAALPDWVYLYLAPQRVSYWDEQQQRLQFLPYPLVLNQGEALFFVRAEQ
jgi:hypothetical protein